MVKLGEVCEKTPNVKWNSLNRDWSWYIDLSSVDRETKLIVDHDVSSINEKNAPSRAKKLIKENDVIFATTRPTLKRFCIVPKEYNNHICSTGFCIIRPIDKEIGSKWIYYFLSVNEFYSYISQFEKGANYPAVTDKDVLGTPIPLPPLSEQTRIVSLLDDAFGKLERSREKALKLLDDAKEIFQAQLKKEMTPKKGWEVKMLGEIAKDKCSYGASVSAIPYDKNLPRYVRITDIDNYGNLNDDKVSATVSDVEKYLLHEGDILFARTGATVGKSYLYKPEDGAAIYAGYLIRFIINQEVALPEYIFHFAHSNEYNDWVLREQASAAQPNINAKQFSSLEIPLPPLSEQSAIVSRLDVLSSQLKQIEEKTNKYLADLDELKQSLLKKAFEGKL